MFAGFLCCNLPLQDFVGTENKSKTGRGEAGWQFAMREWTAAVDEGRVSVSEVLTIMQRCKTVVLAVVVANCVSLAQS